nr:porin family protein [Pedobacter cryoconitis]
MFSHLNADVNTRAILKKTCVFVLTLATTISLTNVAIAQGIQKKEHTNKFTDSLKNRIEVGINGGLSLNQFTKGQPQTSSNTGYTAGLLINYRLPKNLSLQLEINALQQGGRMIRFKDDTRIGLPESFNSKNVKNSSYLLNSIEVPLLINYTFKIKPTWKPSVYLGGSYAYTYNVSEKYQKTGDLLPGEDIIATVSGSQNATNLFNTSRFNLIVGANAKLPLIYKFMLLIDFRYLKGLTPARENYSYIEKTGFGSDIKTNSFLTRIGITMPLK